MFLEWRRKFGDILDVTVTGDSLLTGSLIVSQTLAWRAFSKTFG